jgi:hypothetical protein
MKSIMEMNNNNMNIDYLIVYIKNIISYTMKVLFVCNKK